MIKRLCDNKFVIWTIMLPFGICMWAIAAAFIVGMFGGIVEAFKCVD